MKRIVLMGLSAVIGILLLIPATRTLRADTQQIPDGGDCNYSMYTCSYASGAYWDGCDPSAGSGWISSTDAKGLCKTYHSS